LGAIRARFARETTSERRFDEAWLLLLNEADVFRTQCH
jgi:hypothetical protein